MERRAQHHGTATVADRHAIATSYQGMQLGKVMSHPIRMKALAILNRHTATPKEIADELGEPTGNVAYHVSVLVRYGYIELVDIEMVRGAPSHRYRAVNPALITLQDSEQLPGNVRNSFALQVANGAYGDFVAALRAGALTRHDHVFAHDTVTLDDEGWKDAYAVLHNAMREIARIQDESTARLLATSPPGRATHASAYLQMHQISSTRDAGEES